MTKSKSLSAHISRRDPNEEEFDAAIEEFHNGTDRVAGIMGAALVENNLIKAIKSALEDSEDLGALFHEESAPFGTFKARTVAGKALGLFGKEVADDLDLIRDIRNQFAHALLSLTFENEHIRRRCAKLTEYKFGGLGERDISDERMRFEMACWAISLKLLKKAGENLKARTNPDFPLKALGGIRGLMGLGAEAAVSARRQGRRNDILNDIPANKTGIKDKD
jgi:hypothetical protein